MLIWLCAALTSLESGTGLADDAACMARLERGDASAIADLYDHYGRIVYSLALRIVGDERDAEEIVQDVFADAWRRASSYQPARGTVAAWLLVMTRSRALDRVRARRARPDMRAPADERAVLEVAAAGAGPAERVAADEDALRVRRALAGLPLLQRIAIELAYFEGLTQSEIADRLEQPLGTVKTRIRTGLLKLREALMEAGS